MSDWTRGRPPISEPKFEFDPPDRRQHVAADAKGLFGVREGAGLPRHRRLAVGDALLVDQAVHVVPDRRLELGLRLLELEHLHVRLQAVERPIEGRVRDAGADGVRPQRGDASTEVGPRGRRGRGRRQGCETEKDDASHAAIIVDSARSVEPRSGRGSARAVAATGHSIVQI